MKQYPDYEEMHESKEYLRTPDWVYEQGKCRLCGAAWPNDDIDEDGTCPFCIIEGAKLESH